MFNNYINIIFLFQMPLPITLVGFQPNPGRFDPISAERCNEFKCTSP